MAPSILLRSAEQAAIKRLAESLRLPAFLPGTVWLAGAGPGDPGLATLLGLHALVEADVVLFDALVNDELLSLARPGAKLVFAGKRRGQPSCKQSDISRALVAHARKGERVLRLKGGDPFVFGRGAEEALALVQAGISFRVVPGVTAGIGGLAYAGIPLTHRDTNHVVTLITGHGADGGLPDIDWRAIARGSPTLVFYMALGHADDIAKQLIEAGRPIDEPAAIVVDASRETQAVIVTRLDQLAEAAKQAHAPAMIVVGENVKLRAGLDWLGALTCGTRLEPHPLGHKQLRDVS